MSFLDDLSDRYLAAEESLRESVSGALSTAGDAALAASPAWQIYDNRQVVVDAAENVSARASAAGESIEQTFRDLQDYPNTLLDRIKRPLEEASSWAKWAIVAVVVLLVLAIAYVVFMAFGAYKILDKVAAPFGAVLAARVVP